MTPDEAFAAGQSAGGNTNTSAVRADITGTKGAATVGDYATSTPQSSYWSGGSSISGLITGGNNTIVDCNAGTGYSDAKGKNHCEAVNALVKQPSLMPAGVVDKSDPIYVKGRAIGDNPEAIAGAMSNLYSDCTTTTTTSSPEKTIETCDDYSTVSDQKCLIGQEVTVDADHLYKCQDSVKVTVNSQCTVGRVVEVDSDANYQCVKTELEYETLKCNKIAIVTATQGPWPAGTNQTIGGYFSPPKFASTKYIPRVYGTSLSNNPATGTATVTLSLYHRRGWGQSFAITVWNPQGTQIAYKHCPENCSQTVAGEYYQCTTPCVVSFAAPMTGSYTVLSQIFATYNASSYSYGYINQSQDPPTVSYTIDNQCTALEARL